MCALYLKRLVEVMLSIQGVALKWAPPWLSQNAIEVHLKGHQKFAAFH